MSYGRLMPASPYLEKSRPLGPSRRPSRSPVAPYHMDQGLSMTSEDIANTPPASRHIPPIGVIIPTYNRAEVLVRALEQLEAQTWTDFEVIVVDDGSTDATPQVMEEFRHRTKLDLQYLSQPNSGPARARNQAIRVLRAPVCLMIGDDIFASPNLVLTHLQLHERRPEIPVAAVGLTRWSESGQRVTNFMRWLDHNGMQFDYQDLLEGKQPDWRHFYTSNLSVKTKLLRENPFNENFTKAAMEDTEVAYRLQKNCGLQMVFLTDALAYHLHPTSFHQACRRMVTVGAGRRYFDTLWPECQSPARSWLRRKIRRMIANHPKTVIPFRLLAGVLTRFWCPNPLMRVVLNCCYTIGYSEGGIPAKEQSLNAP
jgi:GT2 family glycosyltransferase